jgi:23S rRNA (uracil1939-C5)-methyltransferase
MEIKCLKLNQMKDPVCEPKIEARYILPNETATFMNRKNKVIMEQDIISKSPHRVKVVCPIFYDCGGCDFLHINYNEQLRMKEWFVKDLYLRSNIKTDFLGIIENKKPLNYRHKVVLSAKTVKNRLRLGLYRENTKEIIPYLNCHIHDQDANKVLRTIEELLNKYKIPAYDIDKNTGIIKHVLIRKSYANQEMLIVFVTNGNLLPNGKKIAIDIISEHPNVKTVVQNIHHKKTNLVLLEEEKVIYGSGYIVDIIDGLHFRLSSQSFYQVNPLQMINLYHEAIKLSEVGNDDVVIDTYSGIGTISLLLSKQAKMVYAIESNKKSHLDALHNKKINKIENIQLICDDVSNFLLNFNQKIDILFMDPTRDGASDSFIKLLIDVKPKKIIYISCNPITQVRDLKKLKEIYDIKKVLTVDMFSQTEHVESITLLSLKSL